MTLIALCRAWWRRRQSYQWMTTADAWRVISQQRVIR
jgi:hypothetical protein